LKKYLQRPRHIEIQVFADQHGNTIHLFERDCSIQRRQQKIIEQAPAPGVDAQLRQSMGEVAVKIAEAIDYVGAGTVEFLLDDTGHFYFMEMNTRLQVEHPVTEMITGLDLVAWQLNIAAGKALPLQQKDIKLHGHAIEVRIYAEDPYQDFLPSSGKIVYLAVPEEDKHVRIDSGVETGDDVTPYYDPLLAKLIVWDVDRGGAIKRLQRALNACHLVGVSSNIPLLRCIVQQEEFIEGQVHTGFIDQHETLLLTRKTDRQQVSVAILYCLLKQQQVSYNETDPYSPWAVNDAWQMNLSAEHTITLLSGDETITVQVHYRQHAYQLQYADDTEVIVSGHFDVDDSLAAIIDGETHQATVIEYQQQLHVFTEQGQSLFALPDTVGQHHHEDAVQGQLTAPMPGTIVAVLVKSGDKIKRGDRLVILEAMKMEHTVCSPHDGIVEEIHYDVGEQVSEGSELLVVI